MLHLDSMIRGFQTSLFRGLARRLKAPLLRLKCCVYNLDAAELLPSLVWSRPLEDFSQPHPRILLQRIHQMLVLREPMYKSFRKEEFNSNLKIKDKIMQHLANNSESIQLFCGLDWASRKHYYVLKNAQRTVLEQGFIDNCAEGFDQLFNTLYAHAKGAPVALILEANRGAPLNALIDIDWIKLCPVDTVKTKKLNQLEGASKGKSDARDAHLLCDYLIHKAETLMGIYVEKDSSIRQLRQLVSLEHELITQVTALKNRIWAQINGFIPELRTMIADLESVVYQKYLLRFNPLKPVSAQSVRTFLCAHNVRGQDVLSAFIQQHCKLRPLGKDRPLHKQQLTTLRVWVKLLQQSCLQLRACQHRLDALFSSLPSAEIYRSLPAVGPRLAPRLASLIGSQPQKAFPSKQHLLAYFGQSPITRQSGNSRHVAKRKGCNKLARHVCFLWARCAGLLKETHWQRAFLAKTKQRGDARPTGYRKLGMKMLAILYRCLETNTPYSETIYQKNLSQNA